MSPLPPAEEPMDDVMEEEFRSGTELALAIPPSEPNAP